MEEQKQQNNKKCLLCGSYFAGEDDKPGICHKCVKEIQEKVKVN